MTSSIYRIIAPFITSLLLLSSATSAQVAKANIAIPDTPAGHMLQMWLKAFDSGDAATVQGFYEQHMPAPLAGGAVGFSRMTGGVDLVAVEANGPQSIVFIAKDRATPNQGLGIMTLMDAVSPKVQAFSLGVIPAGTELLSLNIDVTTQKRVIDATAAALNDSYVDPDVAKRMEADLRARLSKGEFSDITDRQTFSAALTDALRSVSHDKHLSVNFSPAKLPPPTPPSPEEVARQRTQMQDSHCGFEPAQHLPGNISLLKFNAFPAPDGCTEAASAALNSLGNPSAIILDFRDNGGGSPPMVVYIASYFFADRTHLEDIWTRKTGTTEELWTRTDAPGTHYVKQPVFILTSQRTFSGAESFSYDLQALKRATVIGETTGGGAHPTAAQPLGDGFTARVPFAKSINSVTHTNWEGTGVEPNVKVPASQALDTAQKLAAQAPSGK